ncbi:hypothetical protein ACVWZR_009008 [Bradyrhizobium sp. i1.3.1]
MLATNSASATDLLVDDQRKAERVASGFMKDLFFDYGALISPRFRAAWVFSSAALLYNAI